MTSAVLSPRAEAGFLSASDAVRDLLDESGVSGPSSNEVPDRQPTRQESPTPQLTLSNPAPSDAGSTSSTGALRLVSSGVYASLLSQAEAIQLPAAERLLIEESALIPAVYLSRVFRPPRV